MKKAILLIIFIFLSACVKDKNEFYNSKEEIMLRSYYIKDFIISYLGVKDNKDILIIASKTKLNSILVDNISRDFESISKDLFNLPYQNDFLYFYKTSFNLINKSVINVILNDDNETSINIQKISKSLEYHL